MPKPSKLERVLKGHPFFFPIDPMKRLYRVVTKTFHQQAERKDSGGAWQFEGFVYQESDPNHLHINSTLLGHYVAVKIDLKTIQFEDE